MPFPKALGWLSVIFALELDCCAGFAWSGVAEFCCKGPPRPRLC